ncbi:unnamed protein product [Boreogadus saida]
MSLFVCVLLCVLISDTACGCTLKNFTLMIEKYECEQCVLINTTICSGYCYTQDTNFRGRVGKNFLIQRGCTPGSLVYRTARLVGCPRNVNPVIYYPEFHRCKCRSCDRRTHHCVQKSRYPLNQCRKTRHKRKGKDSN